MFLYQLWLFKFNFTVLNLFLTGFSIYTVLTNLIDK